MSFRKSATFIVLLMTLIYAVPPGSKGASSIAEQLPQFWLVRFVEIEPHKVDQFERALRDRVQAMRRLELGSEWTWYATRRPDFTYTFAHPLASLSELDALWKRIYQPEDILRESTIRRLLNRERAAIRSYQSELIQHLESWSYHPKAPTAKTPPRFQRVVLEWVRPDRRPQYEEVIHRFREALAKIAHPLGYDAYRIIIGSGSFAYVWMAPSAEYYYRTNNLSELLTRALGREEANRLVQRWHWCLRKRES
ncbi:MAG: hypothetical protein D6723_15680, partial [Acidobacteria bacterium]